MELIQMGNSNSSGVDSFTGAIIASCSGMDQDMQKLADNAGNMVGFHFGHKFHFPHLKDIIPNAVEVVKKVEHNLATVSMAIPRGVFIGGVKMNVAGLAGKILQLYKQDPNKVDNFWKDFGGTPSALHAAIIEGAKKIRYSAPIA